MNSIFKRSSVRNFKKKSIKKPAIERLLKAGMMAPSAKDSRPWEFIVVEQKEKREALAKTSPYAKPAEKAPLDIIVLGNMNRLSKDNVWWPQGLSACVQNILLQAVEEGLGGVWLGVYPREDRISAIVEQLNLPNGIIPFAILAIGYPAEEKEAKGRFEADRIHFEKF